MISRFSFSLILLCFQFIAISQCPKLIWSDEFDGNTLNTSNWSYQLGDGCSINLCGWGNNELQWYKEENVQVANGLMTISAKREDFNNKTYTSARIRSINKVDVKYGRIESRMKLPKGQGIWPAFWMMPTANVYGDWPFSGELDIMEYLGHETNMIHGTLHFGQAWPNNRSTSSSFIKQGDGFHNDFHTYALEWTENNIKWFIDGYLYAEKGPQDLGGQPWPFDQKFHFIYNMAVGGGWPGNPNASTVFPQNFQIDYVRLYDMSGASYLKGPQKVATSASNILYTVAKLRNGSTIKWQIPSGASISSEGNDFIRVNFGVNSGILKAIVTSECSVDTLSLDVYVEEVLTPTLVLEDFDTQGLIARTFHTGSFSDNTPNPAKNQVNQSELCGKYVRSSSAQYDVLTYTTNAIKDASKFTTSAEKLTIDIYTNAPIGTSLLIQFENGSTALSSNYPTGRHSRYEIRTTKQNEWETLVVPYLDKPDGSVPASSVNQIIILFASNTFTGHNFYFDNFKVLGKALTGSHGQLLEKEVKIFPVPTTGELNIRLEDNEKIRECIIFDNKGAMVFKELVSDKQETTLDVKNLPTGSYALTIVTKSGLQKTSMISILAN